MSLATGQSRCGDPHGEAEVKRAETGSFFQYTCVHIISINVFKITTYKKIFLMEAVLTLVDAITSDCNRG